MEAHHDHKVGAADTAVTIRVQLFKHLRDDGDGTGIWSLQVLDQQERISSVTCSLKSFSFALPSSHLVDDIWADRGGRGSKGGVSAAPRDESTRWSGHDGWGGDLG